MIIPYVNIDNKWSIDDRIMVSIFRKMKEFSLDRTVFKNEAIVNDDDWLKFLKTRSNVIHIDVTEGVEGVNLIAWLNTWGINHAYGHFCFFPHTWGKTSVQIGRKTIRYWFEKFSVGDWSLDAIIGQVPSSNKHAVDFTQKLGLRKLGEIKSIKYKRDKTAKGATLFVIERGDYYG